MIETGREKSPQLRGPGKALKSEQVEVISVHDKSERFYFNLISTEDWDRGGRFISDEISSNYN